MEWRLLRPLCAETLCVAHLIRLLGVETLPSLWSGVIAILVPRALERNAYRQLQVPRAGARSLTREEASAASSHPGSERYGA